MSDERSSGPAALVSFEGYMRLDIRVGTIVDVQPFPEARVAAYKLKIDFGDLGARHSSAQITKHYTPAELVGKQVACVLNFPPKRIAGFSSEVLVLGAVPEPGDVVLLHPERRVRDGSPVA